jgi:hypothetical protein
MIDRVPLLVQPNITKDIPFGPLDAMQCITRWSLSFGPAIKAKPKLKPETKSQMQF